MKKLLPSLFLAVGLAVVSVPAAAQHDDRAPGHGGASPAPSMPRLRGLDNAAQGHGAGDNPRARGRHTGGGSDHAPAGDRGGAGDHASGDHGGAGDHASSDHGGHEGGHHELKSMNWTDFSNKETPPFAALLLNLGLLVGLYYWMGKKPVQDGLKARRQAVAKEIEEAQRMLKEAEERAKVYQAKLGNVAAEQEAAQKALETAGKGERDRIVREAEEKAARMQRDAEFLVEQERKQMRLDLTREAIEVAVEAAEALLREKVTQADHERMADEFLAELAQAPAQSGGAS